MAGALLGVSCYLPPAGIQRLEPPASWERIHEELEDCTGRSRAYSTLHWYTAPRVRYWGRWGEEVRGMYVGVLGRGSILLEERSAADSLVVRHELLHHLDYWSHDSETFVRCQ